VGETHGRSEIPEHFADPNGVEWKSGWVSPTAVVSDSRLTGPFSYDCAATFASARLSFLEPVAHIAAPV